MGRRIDRPGHVGRRASVADRVSVEKSSKRTLMLTVRPRTPVPPARARRPFGQRQQLAGQIGRIGRVDGEGGLRADGRIRDLGLHGPLVASPGQIVQLGPAGRPEQADQLGAVHAPRSRRRCRYRATRSRSAVRGPDSPQRAHRQRMQQSQMTSAGGTISNPSGLARPDASLATNLVDAAPTVAIRPSSAWIRARSACAIDHRAAELPTGARRRRGMPRPPTAARPAA